MVRRLGSRGRAPVAPPRKRVLLGCRAWLDRRAAVVRDRPACRSATGGSPYDEDLPMTPQQAGDGLVELMLPDGGHVLVGFREETSINPAVEASVVQVMLDATGNEDEVREALAHYAEASGFSAELSRDRGSIVLMIG